MFYVTPGSRCVLLEIVEWLSSVNPPIAVLTAKGGTGRQALVQEACRQANVPNLVCVDSVEEALEYIGPSSIKTLYRTVVCIKDDCVSSAQAKLLYPLAGALPIILITSNSKLQRNHCVQFKPAVLTLQDILYIASELAAPKQLPTWAVRFAKQCRGNLKFFLAQMELYISSSEAPEPLDFAQQTVEPTGFDELTEYLVNRSDTAPYEMPDAGDSVLRTYVLLASNIRQCPTTDVVDLANSDLINVFDSQLFRRVGSKIGTMSKKAERLATKLIRQRTKHLRVGSGGRVLGH